MILPSEIPNHPVVPETAVVDFIPVVVIDRDKLGLIAVQDVEFASKIELRVKMLPQEFALLLLFHASTERKPKCLCDAFRLVVEHQFNRIVGEDVREPTAFCFACF